MDKISAYTSTADGNDEFTEGNPSTGTPATEVDGGWLNGVQRELLEVMTQMGLTPSSADDTLVWQALQAVYGKTFAGDPNGNVAANVVRERCWDTSKTPAVLYIATAADGTVGGTTWKANAENVLAGLSAIGSRLGFRNGLINGNFRINQRGVSTGAALSLADGEYFFDRWRSVGATTGIQVSTAGVVTLGASEGIEQVIEDGFADTGDQVTVSVADPSADLTVTLLDYSGTDTASGTISSGSGRQGVTLTVPALDSDGHLIVRIEDASAAGAAFKLAQAEHGPIATPFERRPLGFEVELCERFFEKSFDLGVAPQSGLNPSNIRYVGAAYNSTETSGGIKFRVRKRSAPTITFYEPIDGGAGEWVMYIAGAWTGAAVALVKSPSDQECGFGFDLNNASVSPTEAYTVKGHWTADAEL